MLIFGCVRRRSEVRYAPAIVALITREWLTRWTVKSSSLLILIHRLYFVLAFQWTHNAQDQRLLLEGIFVFPFSQPCFQWKTKVFVSCGSIYQNFDFKNAIRLFLFENKINSLLVCLRIMFKPNQSIKMRVSKRNTFFLAHLVWCADVQ